MTIALCTVIIYAKDMHRTARFYSENFGYETSGEVREGLRATNKTMSSPNT